MFTALRALAVYALTRSLVGRPCQVVVVHSNGRTAPCGRRTRHSLQVCTHHLALLS